MTTTADVIALLHAWRRDIESVPNPEWTTNNITGDSLVQ